MSDLLSHLLTLSPLALLLIAARLAPVVVYSPFLPSSYVSLPLRLCILFMYSICTAMWVAPDSSTLPTSLDSLLPLLVREIAFGLILLLHIAAAFWALQTALTLTDSLASLRSHVLEQPHETPLRTLVMMLALTLFALHDGHTLLLLTCVDLFRTLPLGISAIPLDLTSTISALFLSALHLSAPFLLSFAALQLLLGSIQRLTPSLSPIFAKSPHTPLVILLTLLVVLSILVRTTLDATQHALSSLL